MAALEFPGQNSLSLKSGSHPPARLDARPLWLGLISLFTAIVHLTNPQFRVVGRQRLLQDLAENVYSGETIPSLRKRVFLSFFP